VLFAWSAGLIEGITSFGEDLLSRHASTMPDDGRIVMIDINDHALKWVHAWPWPRRIHAELVRTLHELGATAIVLDIVFAEPSSPRRAEASSAAPWFDRPSEHAFGGADSPEVIRDDEELAAAMREVGNVYTAAYFDPQPDREPPTGLLGQAVEALVNNFGLDAGALAERLGEHSIDERTFVEAKARTARRLATDALNRDVSLTLESFLIGVPGVGRAGHRSRDRRELELAFATAEARRAMLDQYPRVFPSLRGHLYTAGTITPPIAAIARSARAVGLATHIPAGSASTVRDVPLLVETGGNALAASLGFHAACDVVGADLFSARREGGRITLPTSGGALHVPIDERGLTRMLWHNPGPGLDWTESFTHVPVSRVMELIDVRRARAENRRAVALQTGELVARRHAETPIETRHYAELLHERRAAERARAQAPDDADVADRRLGALNAEIDSIEEDARMWLRYQHSLWQGAEPADQEERLQQAVIVALHADLIEGGLQAEVDAAEGGLRLREEELTTELRGRVAGSICFVGYTAAALADFRASPVYATSMPGVMAHANMANMVLTGRFLTVAGGAVNAALLVLCGLLVSWVASVPRTGAGVVSSVVVCVVMTLVGAALFAWGDYQVDWASGVTCGVSSWAVVTAYRQATEEREKRRLRRALEQYTARAVAARIADRAGATALAPQPMRVTCFYSDLRGFTELSERLGPSRTRDVLNAYLTIVSDVLIRHGALVNKFVGDGVFAFFNAPILPCPAHASAACMAAAECVAALGRINARPGDGSEVTPLSVRIGIATGEAFVGDYGSTDKLDYTCIGDTPNTGSRLESAAKVFGADVLVDGATRQAAGDGFTFRRLGRFRLSGKAEPVDIHELWRPRDDRTVAERAGAAQHDHPGAGGHFLACFDEAVTAFAQGRFDECGRLLGRCVAQRPDDRPTAWYVRELERVRSGTVARGGDSVLLPLDYS
jgi:class 3 adenylate cyclase